ncbi:MAG TPA: hypothetical protein VFY07_03925, partial [Geomobilimonas sp.]|nr:hypothetical protein [Geomobilimonas sp.]
MKTSFSSNIVTLYHDRGLASKEPEFPHQGGFDRIAYSEHEKGPHPQAIHFSSHNIIYSPSVVSEMTTGSQTFDASSARAPHRPHENVACAAMLR